MRRSLLCIGKRLMFDEARMQAEWRNTAADLASRIFGESQRTRSEIEAIRMTLPWEDLNRKAALTAMVHGSGDRRHVETFVQEMSARLPQIAASQAPRPEAVSLVDDARREGLWEPVVISLNPEMDRALFIQHGLLDLRAVLLNPHVIERVCDELECVPADRGTGIVVGNTEQEYWLTSTLEFPFILVGAAESERVGYGRLLCSTERLDGARPLLRIPR